MALNALKFIFPVVVLILATWPLAAPARGQANPAADSPITSAPAAPPPSVASPTTAMGGCDSSGVSLSRPWIGRNSQIEWWAWGYAYGTTVGVQMIDPTGKNTPMGSFAVDGICEVGGTVSSEARPSGIYTLVITGTRPGGAYTELTTTFHIVTLGRLSSSGGSPAPPAPQVPTTIPPCQATASLLCP